MKNLLTWLLCLTTISIIAQPPTRQQDDLDDAAATTLKQGQTGTSDLSAHHIQSLPSQLSRLQNTYVDFNINSRVAKYKLGADVHTITDKSMRINATSNPDAVKKQSKKQKKYASFNPKKDHIDWYIFKPRDEGGFDIVVVNKQGKYCNMKDFKIEPVTNNIIPSHMASGKELWKLAGTAEDYVCGRLSREGQLKLTHVPSGMSTYIDFTIDFYENLEVHGLDVAYVVQKIEKAIGNWCRVTDLVKGKSWILPYPFKIDASGRDGKNGYNGAPGINGMNEYTWKDKDGKSHYNKGTCGSAGGNGGPGGNGQDGGHIMLYLDYEIPADDITINVAGGKGGNGGSAGLGGVHGAGSGCFGRAVNGVPGRSGANGTNGSKQIVPVDHDTSLKPVKDYTVYDTINFFTFL